MMQRHRQHHRGEVERVIIFVGEFADDEAGIARDILRQIVEAGYSRHHIDQADDDEGDRQDIDDTMTEAAADGARNDIFGHVCIRPVRREGRGENRGPPEPVWTAGSDYGLAQSGTLWPASSQAATAPGWYFTGIGPHMPVFAGSISPRKMFAM